MNDINQTLQIVNILVLITIGILMVVAVSVLINMNKQQYEAADKVEEVRRMLNINSAANLKKMDVLATEETLQGFQKNNLTNN